MTVKNNPSPVQTGLRRTGAQGSLWDVLASWLPQWPPPLAFDRSPQLNDPHWQLVTFSCQSLQVQHPDKPLWKGSLSGSVAVTSHQLACHSPAVARVQLPVWPVLSTLSSVPPSCCVVTSIWSSAARQISVPVRALQQALLCKFNYSSVPYYCCRRAPRTGLTLTVGSHVLLTQKYLIYPCFAIRLYH